MIKLLKYDWKRNANTLVAAMVVLLLAQASITVISEIKNWDQSGAYIFSTVIYAFAGFMAFLMVCQTYNNNLKAYSRRLLPLPSLYAVASPLLLLLASMAVLLCLFLLHEYIYVEFLGLSETIMSTVRAQLKLSSVISLLIGSSWMTVTTVTYVFFCITFARTFESRWGTWLGIAMFIGLATLIGWLDDLFVPSPASGDVPLSITGVSVSESPDTNLMLTVTGFQGVGIMSFVLEVGFVLLLLYGIRYMINRKIKL